MAWVKKPTAYGRKLKKFAKDVDRQLLKALKIGTEEIASVAKERTVPAKRLSRQDAPGGRERSLARRTPVRSKVDKKAREGTVRVLGHWTPARSNTIVGLFRRYGRYQKDMVRKGLFVRGQARRTLFSRNPHLKEWAIARNQYTRHAARIRDKRILRDLAVLPALEKSGPGINRAYDAALGIAARRAGLI